MIGKSILHYDIKEKLGAGGMGEVYHAKDTRLLRPVALKILPSDLTADENNLSRFIQEAQTASSLNHPNICTIHDINEANGINFIVMELVDGITLRELLEDKGPMSERDVIDITIKICDALAAVHLRGILHRDIKPENIMITDSGYLKVMDFGLAKLATDTAETSTKLDDDDKSDLNKKYSEDVVLNTLSGLFGTISYMSPEQAQGKEMDHRSDIFSLGIVLFELLTNKRPFDGESNATILSKIIVDPIVHRELDTQDISTPIRKIINRCLEKEPDSRYQSITELIPELNIIKQKLETELKDKQTDHSIIREPERKQMTVMFAEISNYDEIIGRTEAEEAASIMNGCFDMFAAIVEQHGGKIDNIMSGTIKTLFGTAAESESAHKDAVNSAIQIRNGLVQFNQQFNVAIPLDITIGINTGTVILGTMGTGNTQNYMVMGDAVTDASLLKDCSGSHQILVGALTYKLTKDDFNYTEYESLSVPGKEQQLPVYELLSVKEKIHRPILGSERQIYSEMVGRENELAKLEYRVSKLINGEGFIVNIIGEAGIGKSRLKVELRKNELISQVTYLEGRALSIGKNLSFHPLRDIFKNWAGISEDDSDRDAFEKLKNLAEKIDTENSDEVIPFIATLMGMEFSGSYAERVEGIKGEALEKLILKNLREFLEKAAPQKPIVLVIEDLHWADSTSIEFLELLFRLAEKNSILFINVFRPGYKNTGERILESVAERYPGFHEEVFLESLEEKDGESLINNLLKIDGFSPNITSLISKRASGNPFFIEEVIRSFIDDEVIKIEEGKFVVTERIDSVSIPETLNEVLLSRIDKLDEGTKSLLKMAAVIGRNFFYKIIAEVAKSTEELDYRLSYLQDVQLIKEHKRMQEVEYLFKHALAQVAVYESILYKKRKELHIKTAEVIEAVFTDKLPLFYGTLSYHYSVGEKLDKAEEYLIKAGQEALKSSASEEAVEYFKSALNLYTEKYGLRAEPKKKAMLEYKIGLALQYKGRLEESIEYLDRVLKYYKMALPKNKFLVLLKVFSGFIHLLIGTYLPSYKWKKIRTREVSEKMTFNTYWQDSVMFVFPERGIITSLTFWTKFSKYELTGLGEAKFNLLGNASSFSWIGILQSVHKKTLKLHSEKIDENIVIEKIIYRFSKQLYNWVWGDWNIVAENDYDKYLVEGAIKIGESHWIALYMNQFILTMIEAALFNDVETMLLKLMEVAEAYENDYVRAIISESKTKSLMKNRKLREALVSADEGINFTKKTNARLHNFANLSYKARILYLIGKVEQAEKVLQLAEGFKSEIKVPWYLSDYFTSRLLMDVCLIEKSFQLQDKRRIDIYTKSAHISAKAAFKNSKKFAGDRIEIYRLMGRYYWLTDNQKKALKWWDRSIKFGEESGGRLELSRTFMEVGKRLLEKKNKNNKLNNITAEEYLDKARSMFEEMDLQWDLNELQNISPSRL